MRDKNQNTYLHIWNYQFLKKVESKTLKWIMAYIHTHRYIHTDTCTHICTDTCAHKHTWACTHTHKHIYRIKVETQCFSHALDRSSSSFSLHGLLSMAATSAFTATAAANVYRCSSWKIGVSFFALKFVWFHFPKQDTIWYFNTCL